MNNVNRLIEMKDLLEGDEVIVRGVDLNYMQIVRPPKQKQVKRYDGTMIPGWSASICNRLNTTKFHPNSTSPYTDNKPNVRFDFEYKAIWLVKRK